MPKTKKTTDTLADTLDEDQRAIYDAITNEARGVACRFFETTAPTFEMEVGIYDRVFAAFGEWDKDLSVGQLEVIADLELARDLLKDRGMPPTPADIFAMYDFVLDEDDDDEDADEE